MLTHPTLDLLHELGLSGMARAFKTMADNPEAQDLSHAEWLGLILDHEVTERRQKRFERRSRTARLRHAASIEDIDFRTQRGLDRTLFLKLTSCDWIREHRNLTIVGPCGVGKSWLACALGDKACREDISVLYHRVPRLLTTLDLAHDDGRYDRLMRALVRARLLILDDWGPEPFSARQRRDLLEIVEERYNRGSIVVTSQLPIDRWHQIVGDPTMADAILDRLVHNAHKISLTGDSLRKRRREA